MAKGPPPKKSKTSAFGSPGRSNHDASDFYEARLYANQPQEKKEVVYTENSVLKRFSTPSSLIQANRCPNYPTTACT